MQVRDLKEGLSERYLNPVALKLKFYLIKSSNIRIKFLLDQNFAWIPSMQMQFCVIKFQRIENVDSDG